MASKLLTPLPSPPIKGSIYLLASPPGGGGNPPPPTTGRIWPRQK